MNESLAAVEKHEAWLEHLEAHGARRRPAADRAIEKRRQRAVARSKGLCASCCKRKPAPGYSTCDACLATKRRRFREEQRLIKLAREAGLG